jgi:hypothetical protein
LSKAPSGPGHAPALSKRKRLLFTFFTVILLALFAETSLQLFYRLSVGRWLWEWWAIPIYEADPVRVYRLKSNLDYLHQTSEFTARYLTDETGLRTDGRRATPPVGKSNDTFRILSLGPSFAFGWGVNYEDSYIYKIADGLRVPGKRVELINLGTPSQPISYQLKWLKETGYVYQPDLIVQTVYGDIAATIETNDILPGIKPVVRDGYLSASAQMNLAAWIKRWRGYSATLFYGWHVYHAAIGSQKPPGDGREFYRTAEAESGGAGDQCVQRYRSYTGFVHRVLTNQPPIAFVFIPMAYVVRPSDTSRVSGSGKIINSFEARKQAVWLTSLLKSNEVNMIDPTGALVEKDQSSRMYNLYDIHFTAGGNKVVAEYSLPVIQEVVLRKESNRAPVR